MNYDMSVILFSYRIINSPRNKWIIQTINSVKSQLGLNIQFIIMDDGSTSMLPASLLRSIGNVNIEYHYYKDNYGKYQMLLWALKLCKADVVTTIHDDDYLPHPRSLQRRYKCFKEVKDTALIWTDAFYRRGQMMWKRSSKSYGRTIVHSHRILTRRNYICGASYLMRTDIAKKCLPDRDLHHGEEYDTWLKVSRFALEHNLSVRYCPVVTAVYRLHNQQNFEKVRRMRKKDRKKITDTIQERNR